MSCNIFSARFRLHSNISSASIAAHVGSHCRHRARLPVSDTSPGKTCGTTRCMKPGDTYNTCCCNLFATSCTTPRFYTQIGVDNCSERMIPTSSGLESGACELPVISCLDSFQYSRQCCGTRDSCSDNVPDDSVLLRSNVPSMTS